MSKRAKPGWSHPRYRLVERLGRGGMGTVYLAEDLLIAGRRVALKTYPTQKFPELLQAEFSNLRKLRHPGIAKAFHFGFAEPAAQPFFTMEHLRGAPLDDYLDRLGPPDRGERLRVGGELFVQIASALDYMHRQGLLHLDLKPGNILVLDPADETSPPLAVLIDLGLAQAEGETGTTRGTLPYIAPERLKGRPPDARTDLYSLGATFFRVLTGRHAFRGRSAQDYIQAHLEREPPPAPELPGPLRKILYKLLAKNPSSRFANSSALVQALLTSRDDRNAVFLPSPEGALLVGRDGELETIESWARPDPSRSAVLAVEGGPGMGKTRMLEEAEAIIALHGDGSVFQRVEGGEGADWILELVDQVAILFPPSRREASRYGPLFDGRSRRVRRPADRPEVSSVVDRDGPRALEAQAARWLTERMRERGLYILIDDADRLGAAAGRFLQDLLRRFRGRESAVTATRGKSKRRRGGVIVSRGPGSPLIFEDETIMTLGRLRASDVRQWAECVDLDGIRSGSRRAYRDLFTLSGGVPLLVSLELSARELTGRERRSRRPLDDPLEHVRRLVDSRRGSERRVLEHVALAFMAPTLELLARVLDWSPETVSREVRLLVAAGFLRTDREAGVRFVHDSARDRVLERIPASRKRSIHSRLAREKGETTEAQLESAYHLLKAGEASQALEPARSALDIDPVSRAGRSDLVFEVVDGILRSRILKGPTRWRFADLHAELLLSRGQLDEARSELRSLLRAKSSMTKRDRVTVRRRLARAFHLLHHAPPVLGILIRQRKPKNRSPRPRPRYCLFRFHF